MPRSLRLTKTQPPNMPDKTYDDYEREMRNIIRERGYLDSMSPSSLSGRFAEASIRAERARIAAVQAQEALAILMHELHERFPKP